jgi:NADH-quinone oxidoreductase subunit A
MKNYFSHSFLIRNSSGHGIIRIHGYFPLLLFWGAILGFVGTTHLVNRLLEPKASKDSKALSGPFECGSPQLQSENTPQIPVSYYKIAIIFVLFDLETIFLFLWAIGFEEMNAAKVGTFALFMLLLVIIFFYVINQGILDFTTPKEREL